MNELDVLITVCNRLSESEIEYMISGSVALSFYVEPRMTRDIDIVIKIHTSDVEKMMKRFEKDFYIDEESIREAIRHRAMFNIIHLETLVKVDFIIRKSEEYRLEEFKNKKRFKIHHTEIDVVAIEDLIISKLYWAKDSFSEIQIKDVKRLMKVGFNLEYVKKWSKQLKIEHILQKAINE